MYNFGMLPQGNTPTSNGCSQAVEDLNRQTGAQLDPNDDLSGGGGAGSSARGLMAAVSSLPELTERKRTIDKHMNLMTHLLKARGPQTTSSQVGKSPHWAASKSCK